MPRDAGIHVGDKVKIKKKDDSEHEGIVVGVSGDYVTIHKNASHMIVDVKEVASAEYTVIKLNPGNSPENKPDPQPEKGKE